MAHGHSENCARVREWLAFGTTHNCLPSDGIAKKHLGCPLRSSPLPSSVVPLLSHVWLFATPWTPAHQAPLSSVIFQSSLKLMSIESVMPSNHLILCCPFSSCLQSFPVLGPFPMSPLFTSGGQSIGAPATLLPMTIQD